MANVSNYETIKAKNKPVADNFVYVYSEIEDGGFRKVSKEMLKILLGIATKLSELENDKEFVSKAVSDLENYYLKSETYSREELDDKLSLVPRFSVKVVSSLPVENISETTVYLVPAEADENNLYTEYINVNGLWEILGTQKVPKVEVTKESIEAALGYTPADNAELGKLSDTVNDMSVVEVSETEPTNEKTDIWINPTNEEEYHFYTAEEIDEMLAGMGGGSGGKDGITPHIGDNGNWFIGETDTGVKAQGEKGDKGDDGKTPQKGTDYFTEEDKQGLVTDVLNALPTWTGGSY